MRVYVCVCVCVHMYMCLFELCVLLDKLRILDVKCFIEHANYILTHQQE